MDEILLSYEGELETGVTSCFRDSHDPLRGVTRSSRLRMVAHERACRPGQTDLLGICEWSEKSACLASWIKPRRSTFELPLASPPLISRVLQLIPARAAARARRLNISRCLPSLSSPPQRGVRMARDLSRRTAAGSGTGRRRSRPAHARRAGSVTADDGRIPEGAHAAAGPILQRNSAQGASRRRPAGLEDGAAKCE